MKRTRVVVSGRVQGVFFRASCARLARQAGLGGTVRNLDDGRVEAIFEGDDEAVDRLVAWCRRRPEPAQVEDVDVTPEEVLGEQDFRVVGR